MPIKDLHKEPFSEETITKLDIFEKYLESWLPVAIKSPYIDEINICDFFAGTGKDIKGNEGSPLRIFRVIKKYQETILQEKLRIRLLFNEFLPVKYQKLCDNIEIEISNIGRLRQLIFIDHFNEDFKDLFNKKKAELKNQFNLIFLDQSGIKQITQDIFLELARFSKTDFMFFISSSYFKRFVEDESFLKHHPDMDIQKIMTTKQSEMHRIIFQYYKDKIPNNSPLKLYPFTLKKGRSIYGLIFGTNHPLGVLKFLKIAWETNELNGEANFDIDQDRQAAQMVLFGNKRMSKIEKFEMDLEHYILARKSISNKELFDFTLENGHIIKTALSVIKKLKSEGKIDYSGAPNISYDKCYKSREIKLFKVIK